VIRPWLYVPDDGARDLERSFAGIQQTARNQNNPTPDCRARL
jgi:hypothetical protein